MTGGGYTFSELDDVRELGRMVRRNRTGGGVQIVPPFVQHASSFVPRRTLVSPNFTSGVHWGPSIGDFVVAGTLLSPVTPSTATQPKIFAISLAAGTAVAGMMDISCFFDPFEGVPLRDKTFFYARVSNDDGTGEVDYVSTPVLDVSVEFFGTSIPAMDWNSADNYMTVERQYYLKRLQFSFTNAGTTPKRIYLCRSDCDAVRSWTTSTATLIGTIHVHLD